eukprot:364034-Chlamydomonas_euryale.AAC.17
MIGLGALPGFVQRCLDRGNDLCSSAKKAKRIELHQLLQPKVASVWAAHQLSERSLLHQLLHQPDTQLQLIVHDGATLTVWIST